MDSNNDGQIDYIEWLSLLQPGSPIARLLFAGQRDQAADPDLLLPDLLDDAEMTELESIVERVNEIAQAAAKMRVRLMVDAEHTYFQPLIDHLVIGLQRQHNREFPSIYNTYQCYLKDSYHRVVIDLERAKREGFHFAGKVVRGAYMVAERERAKVLGIPSPVWNSYEESEKSFHNVVEEVLDYIAEGEKGAAPGAGMMVASHNRHSVALTVNKMNTLGLKPDTGVYFGQLLGMADHVTMTLGRLGYKAYKYVPYGPVEKVMPYLIRRTQENSTFLGSPGVQEERVLVSKELRRRLLRF